MHRSRAGRTARTPIGEATVATMTQRPPTDWTSSSRRSPIASPKPKWPAAALTALQHLIEGRL
jgi:hypothetical protein